MRGKKWKWSEGCSILTYVLGSCLALVLEGASILCV
jgi:hypothetical protein